MVELVQKYIVLLLMLQRETNDSSRVQQKYTISSRFKNIACVVLSTYIQQLETNDSFCVQQQLIYSLLMLSYLQQFPVSYVVRHLFTSNQRPVLSRDKYNNSFLAVL